MRFYPLSSLLRSVWTAFGVPMGCCLLSLVAVTSLAYSADVTASHTTKVTLDFNEVDIPVFVRFISELTGKNFVLDETVKKQGGKISVYSPTKVTPDQAYNMFVSALEVARIAVVQKGNVYQIVQMAIGGQVITAYPEHLVGRVVERGDSLLVLAGLDTMVLEVRVPEREVADVAIGARVRFKPRSEPGRTFEGRVVAIAPAAETNGRQRTVLVRSELDNTQASLRAGTTGYAKIYCGDRRLGSILARRGVRTLRTEFWALW